MIPCPRYLRDEAWGGLLGGIAVSLGMSFAAWTALLCPNS